MSFEVVGHFGSKRTASWPAQTVETARAEGSGDRPEVQPEAEKMPEGLWGATEVAAYLSLSVHSLYKMTSKKASLPIPHIRIGGLLRFRKSAIDEWLQLLTISNVGTLRTMRNRAQEGRRRGDDT